MTHQTKALLLLGTSIAAIVGIVALSKHANAGQANAPTDPRVIDPRVVGRLPADSSRVKVGSPVGVYVRRLTGGYATDEGRVIGSMPGYFIVSQWSTGTTFKPDETVNVASDQFAIVSV